MLINPSQQNLRKISILVFAGLLLAVLTAVMLFGYNQYRKAWQASSQVQPFTLKIDAAGFAAAQKRINP